MCYTGTMQYLAILGNVPELSALELNRMGITAEWRGGSVAELSNKIDINQLGGTVKIAEYITTIKRDLEGLKELYALLEQASGDGKKLCFGFSVYAADAAVTEKVEKHYNKKLRAIGIDWKKKLKEVHNGAVRYVESKEPALSSVIVQKEKLLNHNTDFIIAIRKKEIILGRTIEVQDYKGFSKRDFGRPARDHQSGMLPPKVARMMMNIAQPTGAGSFVDAFCGSGTVLQEATLQGHKNIIGVDISKKAITDTKENFEWMKLPVPELHVADSQKINGLLPKNSVECVVGEGYLGPTRPKKTEKVRRQLIKLYDNTITAFNDILIPGGRIVLAVPAWKRYDDILTLPINETLQRLGMKEFHEPIFYGREHAHVLRHIHFLEKK